MINRYPHVPPEIGINMYKLYEPSPGGSLLLVGLPHDLGRGKVVFMVVDGR